MTRLVPDGAPAAAKLTARAIDRFVGHEMSTYAAALAYRALLSLFPFIIFVIALLNLLDVWRLFDMLLEWARTAPDGRVPAAIRQWMVTQARERPEGAVMSVGAGAAIWAVASGARVLRTALNTAFGMPEVRPAWLRVGVSFVAAPVLGVLLVLTLALFMITTRILVFAAQWFDVNEAVVGLWDWVRLPAGFVVAGLVIAALYRFAPSQRQSFRAVMAGTIVASAVWGAASLVFSRSVAGLMQFGVTYGSFSAAIVLLVYLYLAAAGLLFGAELNAVLASERRHRHPPGRASSAADLHPHSRA